MMGFVAPDALSSGPSVSYLSTSYSARQNSIQRRGRAGRCNDGVCFHLVSKDTFDNPSEDRTKMAKQKSSSLSGLGHDEILDVVVCVIAAAKGMQPGWFDVTKCLTRCALDGLWKSQERCFAHF